MNYAHFAEKWAFDPSSFGCQLTAFDAITAATYEGACYLIVDACGYLAYVGKSSKKGARGRIESHQDKRWYCAAYLIKTDESSVYLSADRLEQALIRMYQPYANRQRYTGGDMFHIDKWMLEQYGIRCPCDPPAPAIAPESPPALEHRVNDCGMPKPMKHDKPGDFSMRLAEYFGQIA